MANTQAPTHASSKQPTTDKAVIRLGIIGMDSGHVPEFSKRINQLNATGKTTCQITRFFGEGPFAMDEDRVRQWRLEAVAAGVKPAADMDELLDESDGVLVLSVAGKQHLKHAKPAIERGLPVYIDKPLTANGAEAKEILALVNKHQARCYSASSLRFADEVKAIPYEHTGQLVAIDAFGPGNRHDSNPGVFYYGVHTIEMVDAIWGPGVAAVAARWTEDRTVVTLHYKDGREASLRLEVKGTTPFGATVQGLKGAHQFTVKFDTVYDRLVQAMVGFFEGGTAPVMLEDIVENISVMQAANQSLESGGKVVDIS